MSPHVPTLVFTRHGETDWNVEGRLQGQRDVPVNDKGRAQARRNGEVIAAAIPDVASFDFVASPLSRARETMEIARAAMGLDPVAYRTDERLRELTFGDWESLTLDEIRARSPAEAAARDHDKWRFAPPGGESYAGLAKRIAPWLEGLTRPTLAVAHGGIGRVLQIALAGVDPIKAVNTDIRHDRVFIWKDGAVTVL
jgi:broad specificity phosphatase PhoE